jgi:hypothetical protein
MSKTIHNIHKKSRKHPKKLYPNNAIRDTRLDMSAVGLLMYLLSHKTNYRIKKENVIHEFIKRGNTRNAIETSWRTLETHDYLHPMRVGGKTGVIWIINEIPMSYEDSTPKDLYPLK